VPKVSVERRGFLPYRLHFSLTTLEVERPHRIHSRLDGDFEGTGTWLLQREGDGTRAQLDRRPSVNKAGVKQLSPVLPPLFRANHNWTMRRGRERELRRLAGD
jgi:hypothetical protein